ncbi:MAG TPA: folylpolyglutamate synthase/dihydrofolate synthase family protein [Phycisphaerae bacterium]|nr:folylpolyglutamate synthase/dihydrofolate synthase family protein [Phycisphaerae bacterium]
MPATIRSYQAAVNFLNSAVNYEKMARVGYNSTNFSLARMGRLLAALGNPQRQFKSVHIAGTKGKGSTATMLSCMLTASGMRTGLYTSPHLVDLRERVQLNGEMIAEAEMTRYMGRIAAAVRKLQNDSPTYFELLTALAFSFFAENEVDVAVIETGLGGRLDSTNVLKPEVCGMTNISFDHMAQLGNTLEKIAGEKAGIFKPGVPIVSAPQPREVRKVFTAVAEQVKAPLMFTGKEIEFSYRFESSRAAGPQTRVSLSVGQSRYEHLAVPLPGDHQAINCGVALGLLAMLKERGLEVDDQLAIQGLAQTRLPGRMETIHENPRIIIDGAHNAASVEALMRAIGQNISYDSMVVIFGCRSDKDISGMLEHIRLGADKVIFTAASPMRSADPAELAAEYVERTGKMAQVAASLEEALDIADRAVTREDLICITGSFQLAGQAKLIAEQRYKTAQPAVA